MAWTPVESIATRLLRYASGRAPRAATGAARFSSSINRGRRALAYGENSYTRMAGFFWKRSVNIPAFAAIGFIGGGVGFTRELLQSPQANAFVADYLNQGPQDRGTPLGYWDKNTYYPYSSGYYRAHIPTDLGASGELALALFATRHGR